jgi:ribosomal protein S18 acetylase RimI-like enzyme
MVTYSSAKEQDIPVIAELFLKTFSKTIKKQQKLPGIKEITDVFCLFFRAGDCNGIIVAKDKGKIVGFICGLKTLRAPWRILLTKRLWQLPLFVFTARAAFITPPLLRHFFAGAHITAEAVDAKYRGKGIGRQLGLRILKKLKAQGVKKVLFEAESGNNTIIHLYESLGFVRKQVIRRGKLSWQIMAAEL